MKKIINFIKYNNAFTIIIALVLFSTAGAFASEKVRDNVIGQTVVTKKGVDNSQIISFNSDNFDMNLKIGGVTEDNSNYYISYSYNTMSVVDYSWRTVAKEDTIVVSKSRLGGADLGVYLAEDLKQLIDREMSYLKEAQVIENKKGTEKIVVAVKYTGLKGLIFDSKENELSGYKPENDNKKDPSAVIAAETPINKNPSGYPDDKQNDLMSAGVEKIVQQVTVVKEVVSKETIMEMVREALASQSSSSLSSSSESSASSSELVSSGSSESSSSSSESSSASSTSDVLPSQSSSSTSDVIPAASSSSESSSSASSESSSILPVGEASSSSQASSSEPTSDVGSSSSEAVSSSSSSSAGEAGSESSSSSEPSL